MVRIHANVKRKPPNLLFYPVVVVQVREVKKLDSDMQMLVYENYNKFISATDTIRKMAQNVEGMETEMTDLKSSMDCIADSSATVNASLEGKREKTRDRGGVERRTGK